MVRPTLLEKCSPFMVRPTLLEWFGRTDDAIAKLYVTNSLVTDSGHMEQSIR